MVKANSPIVTELIAFSYASLRRGFRMEPHLHHFFQLDVVMGGNVAIRIEGNQAVRARAGDALLIPPLVRHGYESATGFRQGSFKFHLAAWCWPMAGSRPLRLRVPPLLLQLIDVAGRRRQENQPLGPQTVMAVANLCVIEALGHATTAHTPDDSLSSFRRVLWPLLERIAGSPQADWSVAGMARECHLSVDHFSRCFRGLLKQTPHRHLLEARMRAAAAALLADPPRPIKEIAEAANYATVHAFTTAFKKAFGTSPAAYRRARPEW